MSEQPNAQDTLEGIVHWWLLAQRIKRLISDVKKALAALESDRLILTGRGNDRRTYYRVNPRKLGQIRARLAQERGGPPPIPAENKHA